MYSHAFLCIAMNIYSWPFLAAFGISSKHLSSILRAQSRHAHMILTMNTFQSAVEVSGEYKSTGRKWAGSILARIFLPTVPRKGSLLLLSCKYLNNNNFILTCSRLQDWVGKAHRGKVTQKPQVLFLIPWFLCTSFWYTPWLVNLTVDVNQVSRLSSQPRLQGSLSFFDQKPWLRLVTWLPKSESQK